jgi:hypothetical protein
MKKCFKVTRIEMGVESAVRFWAKKEIPDYMKTWIGKSVIVIGILHTVVGIIVFYDALSIIISERLFNTITLNQRPNREAAFWFFFSGFALLIIGGLIDWIERNNVDSPTFLLWSFLSITAMGALIMPVSGFWLLFIPTIGLFRWQKKVNK